MIRIGKRIKTNGDMSKSILTPIPLLPAFLLGQSDVFTRSTRLTDYEIKCK